MKNIKIVGVLVGFFVIVVTTIALSILSPFIFAKLVRTGDTDVLMTSTGPLCYALLIMFVASALGVFICHRIVNSTAVVNTILIVSLYATFTYWLSTFPSNQATPYPQWYVVLSYLLLLPGAFAGHLISIRSNKNKKN